jgi:enterochelin esterase-like enzyme
MLGVLRLDAKFLIGMLTLALLLSGCRSGLSRNVADESSEGPAAGTPVLTGQPSPVPDMSTPTPVMPGDADGEGALPPTLTLESTYTPTATPTPIPSVCPYLHGRTEIATMESSALGEQVRYLVHLPPCYEAYATKAFPTLYLFHGWPLDEWHWDDLGIDEWSDDWVSRGIIGPYIVILPGVSQDGLYVYSSGGDHSFEGFVTNELVPAIDAAYRTLPTASGRAVGGISRGAVWALEIALRHQDLFGSVGAHSPALALNRPLPQYNPYLLVQEGVSGLRIYLDAGDGDWSRAAAIQLRNDLQELEADVTYEVHTGGHVDALWRGAMPDYIAFYSAFWPASYDELPEWAPTVTQSGGE